jgi:hypothetical protein
MKDHLHAFAWKNLEPLLGRPRSDSGLANLFAQAGLSMDELWRELRIGIESMPPHDQQPASAAEIDLTPSHHVRLRFRHACTVKGAMADGTHEFVLASVTYFLDPANAGNGYTGDLPAGLEAGDSPARIVERTGRPPSGQRLDPSRNHGFMVWEDRNPVLHVLLSMPQQQLQRVNVFLAPA